MQPKSKSSSVRSSFTLSRKKSSFIWSTSDGDCSTSFMLPESMRKTRKPVSSFVPLFSPAPFPFLLLSNNPFSLLAFSACFFSNSSLILVPARRIRSLPNSQMFLNPALNSSLSSSVSSGICTIMNFLLPPSSALSCITAWAVVEEPLKKSTMMESLSECIFVKSLTRETGFFPFRKGIPPSLVKFFVSPT